MKETDLGPPVLAWLTARGWATYQEVPYHGQIADIVAIAGPTCWVIELKTSFSFALIDQLMYWHGIAHYRSAATPRVKTRRGGMAQDRLLSGEGIGHLSVTLPRHDYEKPAVYEGRRPRLDRSVERASKHRLSLIESCLPEHASGEYGKAGSNEGGRWTPWRRTCHAVLVFVREHPACSMKEMIAGISGKHHYYSDEAARGALLQWLRVNKLPGVRWVHRSPHHPRGGWHRMVLIPAETSVESW